MGSFNQSPRDVSCEGNALAFAIRNMMQKYVFIDIVQIVKVYDENKFVDVKKMVLGSTADGEKIDASIIYNIPYLQLQRASSAVIMEPVQGDIGLAAFCDRDTSIVRASKLEAMAGSSRMHSPSDGIYLTGIGSLNSEPTQYVSFRNDGIDVVSPLVVNVEAPNITMTAENNISLNAPTIILNGALEQGSGSNAGTATFKNGAKTPEDFVAGDISLKSHLTSGVEPGSGESGAPVA